MKPIVYAAIAAATLALPALSLAQQATQPVTRAQVRAELTQATRAGYRPNDWVNYPENLHATEQQIQAEDTFRTNQATERVRDNAPDIVSNRSGMNNATLP
ncbi:DUF4148 domain-containing protein [Paraburkholderia sp. RP-4-7]|uniref:DUF4148 domain-containing protein n=1 Tax=Paraburkholderia polaris TaxID=2728848 RepID=A0A848IYK3_9BURK|nr:DUF4148 domain-containing protein [Paraburkholderia polaris]NMM04027.1 DUF4148 domain-containing protein [Paraburkholderia polaris]